MFYRLTAVFMRFISKTFICVHFPKVNSCLSPSIKHISQNKPGLYFINKFFVIVFILNKSFFEV